MYREIPIGGRDIRLKGPIEEHFEENGYKVRNYWSRGGIDYPEWPSKQLRQVSATRLSYAAGWDSA